MEGNTSKRDIRSHRKVLDAPARYMCNKDLHCSYVSFSAVVATGLHVISLSITKYSQAVTTVLLCDVAWNVWGMWRCFENSGPQGPRTRIPTDYSERHPPAISASSTGPLALTENCSGKVGGRKATVTHTFAV